MSKKLAIFDLDGTLFNTNDVNYNAYKKALEEFGYTIDYNYFCNFCNGKKYNEFLPKIVNDNNIIDLVHRRKKELYHNYIDKAKINTHLFDMIKILKKEYKIIIVTTASNKNTVELLTYYKFLDLFDMIISQDDVVHTKPDPEGFNLAIKRYNSTPNDTIIFEDSESGLKAAKRTGATVFKVEQF